VLNHDQILPNDSMIDQLSDDFLFQLRRWVSQAGLDPLAILGKITMIEIEDFLVQRFWKNGLLCANKST
jgi:hypothetical protein